MTEDEDAKTLKILEDLIRRVVREELERALVFRQYSWQARPTKSIAGGLVDW